MHGGCGGVGGGVCGVMKSFISRGCVNPVQVLILVVMQIWSWWMGFVIWVTC